MDQTRLRQLQRMEVGAVEALVALATEVIVANLEAEAAVGARFIEMFNVADGAMRWNDHVGRDLKVVRQQAIIHIENPPGWEGGENVAMWERVCWDQIPGLDRGAATGLLINHAWCWKIRLMHMEVFGCDAALWRDLWFGSV